jgi:purine nucleosidase
MTPRPVILDCDPGIDDAISLLVAMASPDEFNILGITTVAGNVDVETGTTNACGIRELAKRNDIPIYAGCPRPLVNEPVFAEHIHGDTGLGGCRLPAAKASVGDRHAVDFIIDTLSNADDNSVTLVPTGPLTNIAVALIKTPAIASKIREIVLMGGARREGGNITASAEFNMKADPHAAHVVMKCGRPIIAIGLDATTQFRCSPARMKLLDQLDSPVGHAAAEMLGYVNQVYADYYGEEGAALHDPCTIAYLLAPHLFKSRPCLMEIEISSQLTSGHTAIDLRGKSGRPDNALWVDGLDPDAVFSLIIERLRRL